jgi:hypothetical protein
LPGKRAKMKHLPTAALFIKFSRPSLLQTHFVLEGVGGLEATGPRGEVLRPDILYSLREVGELRNAIIGL